jgi:hypothetical protein
MEDIPSKLHYKTDSIIFYKNIFPWLSEKQINRYFDNNDIIENISNGILFCSENEYYFLTPLILKCYNAKYISQSLSIDCEIYFNSIQYELSLFKLKETPLEKAINIKNLNKIIPRDNDNIIINSKKYNFKKELKPIIGRINTNNLYYIVNDIIKGLPVYYENDLIGMSISNNKILNILSIINFLDETIKYTKYSGLFTLYYDFKNIDNKTIITTNYNICNNILVNDILLEIDGYEINKNMIHHILLGEINIFTYITLYHNNDTIINLKVLRNDIIEMINIEPKPLYQYELICTNLNNKTVFKKKNKKIYYILNNNIIIEIIKLGGYLTIENKLKYIINNLNIYNNESFIMLYNNDDLKYKHISLSNKIEKYNGKIINTLNDL